MKLVRLIKIYISYSEGFETIRCFITNGFEHCFRIRKDRLKLNATHQLLVCNDEVNLLGETIKENQKLY
jgi:hypothetical protein